MRIRAIYRALYHGFMPYWAYEKERHYNCSYFEHLVINLKYAKRWLLNKQTLSDIKFEKQ